MISLRRTDVRKRVGDNEGLQPGQCVERNRRDLVFAEFLDIDAAPMSQRHRGRAKAAVVRDREIDLVFSRHSRLEGNAVSLCDCIAMPMLREIKPLLFGQCRFQIAHPGDKTCLALFSNAALEDGFDEYLTVPFYQCLNVIFACTGSQHFRAWKTHMFQQSGPVQQSGNLHLTAPPMVADLGRGGFCVRYSLKLS